ncbi:hypothetical protein AB0D67_36655 [Streptosporangium sp. NPDC048047]|uniref:hypothetical protein n=1 Tax=Streptosporangium sp. NPDC048047 TaxID=3155748 RepID=UPI003434D519
MEIDPDYARQIAREKAGRKVIDDGEITTAGIVALSGVDPVTVSRWANSPGSGFPRRLRHGVYPLDAVLTFLRAYHPKRLSLNVADDELVTLYHFAHLQGFHPATVNAYADHPYLVERRRPENVSTRGVQRWRLGELKHFWTHVRPWTWVAGAGRPDPLTAQVRALLERAHENKTAVSAAQVAEICGIPLPRAEKLIAAAQRQIIRAHPERDPLLPAVIDLLAPVIADGRRPSVRAVMHDLGVPRARAAALVGEAGKHFPATPSSASPKQRKKSG